MDISSTTARIVPDLLKALAILSDLTVRSAVDREDLKPYWKSEKRLISLGDQQLYYLQDFTNHRQKTNRVVFLAVELSPTSLNTGTTNETFQ